MNDRDEKRKEFALLELEQLIATSKDRLTRATSMEADIKLNMPTLCKDIKAHADLLVMYHNLVTR